MESGQAFVEDLITGPTPTAFPLPTQVPERLEQNGRPGDEESGAIVVTVEPDDGDPFAEVSFDGAVRRLETEHFTFYTEADGGESSWSALRPWTVMEDEAEVIFDYVSQRLDSEFDERIDVHFRPPAGGECPPRGMAMPSPPEGERDDEPLIFLFVGPETTEEQIKGVLAHEVAHIVHLRGMPEALGGTPLLAEGLATWAAEAYQADWYDAPSYDALVLQYLIDGNYLPLHRYHELSAVYDTLEPGQDCLQLRDTIYTEWAAFIGFLLNQYGWERFAALMQSTANTGTETEARLRPPDYEGVYGLALNQLEAQWLAQLLEATR